MANFDPNETQTITDQDGRKLTFRLLDFVEQAELALSVGGPAASNETWMNIARLCAAVRSIDGVPCLMPTTLPKARNQIGKVGKAGTDAIFGWFAEQAADAENPDEVAKVAADQAIKNS
jgi:hypothetical protein